jgi:signal peptidase
MAVVKRLGLFVGSAAVTFAVAVVLSPLLLVPFGFRSATVMSGSMTPTLNIGDIVIQRPIEPGDARIGDVITFTDPENEGRLLTHRVRSIKVKGDDYKFTTKGDANNTEEKWHIPADGTIGRVSMSIPKVGYLIGSHRGPLVRVAFVVIPALLWAMYELVNIWRPKKPVAEPPAPRGPGTGGRVPPPPPPLDLASLPPA